MANSTQQDLLLLEKKLLERQEKLDAKQEQVDKEKESLDEKRQEYSTKLASISGLTKDEATKRLLEETEKDAAAMMARIIKERQEEAKQTSDKKAQELILDSIKHGALSFIPEYTVSIVKVEAEDVKGRII